jgi:flagellar assembly protein FliH
MARIHRVDGPRKAMADFGRGALDEFPDAPRAPLPGEATDDTAEEEQLDPETIRMMVFEEAKEEAERKVQEAYQEGLRRGREAGEAAFNDRIAGIAEQLEEAVAAIARHREAFLESLEPEVVELVQMLARRVLARECASAGDALVLEAAHRGLSGLADAQEIVVRVHPDALAAMREHRASLLEKFPDVVKLRIEADETIETGGCVVETSTQQMDVRPSVLLNQLIEDVFGGGDGAA